MRTLKLIAILGFNCAAECFNLLSAQLALQELEYQARLKEQRRQARLKSAHLPEYVEEMFQGGKKPTTDS